MLSHSLLALAVDDDDGVGEGTGVLGKVVVLLVLAPSSVLGVLLPLRLPPRRGARGARGVFASDPDPPDEDISQTVQIAGR